ncbi:MAG: endopeptidase La [Gemmatimonadota bacterium]|nr:endopeptidase La [Gemmatimonadota bacterium]
MSDENGQDTLDQLNDVGETLEIDLDLPESEETSDDDEAPASNRVRLPVIPLRGTVVFPAVAAPIAAGRDKTMKAIEAAIQGDRLLFAVAQIDAEVEDPVPEALHQTGTICRIAQMQKVPGGVQMVIQGDARAAALEYTERDGYLEVVARRMHDMEPLDLDEPAFAALYKEVTERASEVSRLRGVPKEIVDHLLGGVSTPGELADLVSFYTELEVEEKQKLLETLPVEERLRALLLHLQKQIGLLEAQEQIREQVQEELGERQREVFLREQMKTIQKELGEDVDSQEIEDLRERIEALDLPEEARQEVDRELRRLERIPRESAEAQVVRTYLETVADLPWSETTDERLDIKAAEEVLERDHYGLQDVKDRVLDFLAVRKLQEEAKEREEEDEDARAEAEAVETVEGPASSGETDSEPQEAEEPGGDLEDDTPGHADDRTGQTLLFVGPPGVGKTSIARSIAEAMGRKYVRVSLGGARDEADIRGHRRTYVGAMAGRIIEGLKRAGTKNPVFLLDEIDKLGVSFQGDPSAALMEVLDPAQNDAFVDHYLGVPFDLSQVLFIATANVFQQIPGPLRDRMEAIEFRGYTEAEKLEIAKRFLLPRQTRQNGLVPEQLEVTDDAIRKIVSSYTREAGVRNLERELGAVCRKSARKVASGDAEVVTVDEDDLRELLGQPKVHPEKKMEEDTVGVATGMFYTPAGGDIMLVETSVMKGKEGLVLTGQLGDVMKESAQAALTFARSHASELSLVEERLREHEVHVHVPAGAVPKEGPSAGIAMAVALVSALGDHPVRHDVAMTGEITLTGRVLPIGGVKEKVLGACRAGIHRIILPAENEGDLEDLPDEVCGELDFHLVENLHEALAAALADVKLEDGSLSFSRNGRGGAGATSAAETETPEAEEEESRAPEPAAEPVEPVA